MPAELIIGGVSLVTLISTFETAFKLYITLVESTRSAGSESRLLGIKIYLEQQRFELYGEYVGLLRSQDGSTLVELPIKSQSMVHTVIKEIETLLSDSGTLQSKYGVAKIEDTEPQAASSQPDVQSSNGGKASTQRLPVRALTFPTQKLNYPRKVLWVWKDSKKMSQLHQHLRELNDTLWATLSLQHWSNLQKALPSFILPGQNNAETLSEIRDSATEDGGPSLLVDCAEMRRSTRLSLQEMECSETWRQLKLSKNQVHITAKCKGKRSNRCQGLLTKGPHSIRVLVEYKVMRQTESTKKRAAKSRIQQLAYQLQENRDPDIGLFQCEGFFEDTHLPRFGLVLRMPDNPGSGIVSLDELLADQRTFNQIDLGQRFALARALCYAVLQWHASGWLHKSIDTENIIFLKNDSGSPILFSPKLVGFGSSRPDEASEESLMTLPSQGVVEWFRHPEYQDPARKEFRRSYDYYSLGVVLLAIGYWDTVENLAKKFEEKQPLNAKDAKKWAQFLGDRVQASLGARCGNIYRDVVLRCLRADFGLDENANEINQDSSPSEWQKAFLFTVVKELSRCVA